MRSRSLLLSSLCTLTACGGVVEVDETALTSEEPYALTIPETGAASFDPDSSTVQLAPAQAEGFNDVAETTPVADCAVSCVDLRPQATADQSRRLLQSCLNRCDVVTLHPGAVFRLEAPITVPSGALLTTEGAGPASAWAELRAIGTPRFASNRLVTVCSRTESNGCGRGELAVGGTLRFLKLNMNNVTSEVRPNSVINVDGRGNVIEHVEVFNPLERHVIPRCGPTVGPVNHHSALAFNPGDADNVVRHAKLHGLVLGVVFGAGLTSASNNVVEDSEIFMNRSNPITFAGFGIARRNHIHDNGWCVGDGLEGGAIYCARNHNGGVLSDNEIHDTCRDVIDFDDCWHMKVLDNHLYNPGTRRFPAPVGDVGAKCNSAATMRTGVPRYSTYARNRVENQGRDWNTVGVHFPSDDRFSATGAAAYSDLPDGRRQSLAYLMVKRRDQGSFAAIGNDIRDNVFVATCDSPACVGMGYYVARGTGLDVAGNWSAATTNAFRGNRVGSSPRTSRRCGANWYAGGAWAGSASLCQPGSTAQGCNADDYAHEGHDHGAAHSAFRNCGCRTY